VATPTPRPAADRLQRPASLSTARAARLVARAPPSQPIPASATTRGAKGGEQAPGGERQGRPGHPPGPVQLGGQADGQQGRARPDQHHHPPEGQQAVRRAVGQQPAAPEDRPQAAGPGERGRPGHQGGGGRPGGLDGRHRILKIDRSFVERPSHASDNAELARTIVRLGQSLQLVTVAEGVEDSAQFLALRRMGCDVGQGYYFGRPMDSGEISRLLGDDIAPPAKRPATTG
jgi:EAL domain